MPTRIVSRKNADHYKWGGPKGTDCDGWYLVQAEGLSVIEEAMPPGTEETRHHHLKSRQFFLVPGDDHCAMGNLELVIGVAKSWLDKELAAP